MTSKTHKILFTKGILNNLPKKYRNAMFPEDEVKLKKIERAQRDINKLNTPLDIKNLKNEINNGFLSDEHLSSLSSS